MIPPPLPPCEKTAWNIWWTFLWAFALIIVWQLTLSLALMVTAGFSTLSDSSFDLDLFNGDQFTRLLFNNMLDGDVAGFAAFTTIFVICPACWLLGKVRPHWGGWEYLGVERVKWWHWPVWGAVTCGFGVLFGYLGPSLGVEEMDDSMVEMADTTDFPILLFLGVAIAAPLVEEFIFRGVLFRGWRESKMGLILTLVLTSFIWTSLHVQYPAIILWYLFFFGIVLGLAREWTGNIWVPVWMHCVNNVLAIWEMLKYTS